MLGKSVLCVSEMNKKKKKHQLIYQRFKWPNILSGSACKYVWILEGISEKNTSLRFTAKRQIIMRLSKGKMRGDSAVSEEIKD